MPNPSRWTIIIKPPIIASDVRLSLSQNVEMAAVNARIATVVAIAAAISATIPRNPQRIAAGEAHGGRWIGNS